MENLSNQKKSIMIGITIILAIVVVVAFYRLAIQKENKNNKTKNEIEQTTPNNTQTQESIEEQIKKQEEKVTKLNDELIPLIEERDELEKQITQEQTVTE